VSTGGDGAMRRADTVKAGIDIGRAGRGGARRCAARHAACKGARTRRGRPEEESRAHRGDHHDSWDSLAIAGKRSFFR
jgi:hypothetical protein